MKKIELLSPAGNLEKLKYAIRYGADAVYIGGKSFSLRSMASNFTLDDIKEGCAFAHERNAKVYVTCNIVMHESDLENLKEYIKSLEECGVDAVIASSPTILKLVKSITKMEAHVSTQQSVSNSEGVNFFESIGVDRVVLARECSMEDIKEISKNTKIDLEVFIHGGMCAGVSGRCMLSNVMTNRDANRGGCAQSCRWNYTIYQGNTKISNSDFDFTMSSADLNSLEYIPALIDAGICSLKIEGRMKSLHYISSVVSAYRHAIDEYMLTKELTNLEKYKLWISKAENRQCSHGFFKGNLTPKEIIFKEEFRDASHEFTGIVLSYDKKTKLVTMQQRNVFEGNREIEILSSKCGVIKTTIGKIFDKDGNIITDARISRMIVKFKCEFPCEEFDLVR